MFGYGLSDCFGIEDVEAFLVFLDKFEGLSDVRIGRLAFKTLKEREYLRALGQEYLFLVWVIRKNDAE